MSQFDLPAQPAQPTPTAAPPEAVARGLFFALGAVLGGLVLTVVVWRMGFVASITSFVMAAGAVYLYARGAGAPPRKGLVPLIVLIVLGVVASFFAVIASDAWDVYGKYGGSTEGRISFLLDAVFRSEVISEYAKHMTMFGLFAVLGIFGTMRQLFSGRARVA